MNNNPLVQADFWAEIERKVTSNVRDVANKCEDSRESLISHLRYLEIMARTESDRRQTIQIIASARSLLGDRKVLGPHDALFARVS